MNATWFCTSSNSSNVSNFHISMIVPDWWHLIRKRRGPHGSRRSLWSHTYFQLLDFKAKSQVKKRRGPRFHEFNNQLWLKCKENPLTNIIKRRNNNKFYVIKPFFFHRYFERSVSMYWGLNP